MENTTNYQKKLFIDAGSSILDALKQMDTMGKKLLVVTKDDKFRGLISIGDLQRAIIKNLPMDTKIKDILRQNISVADVNEDINAIKKRMVESRAEFMPIVDPEKNIKQILFWEDVFTTGQKRIEKKINLPVVIMAGGRGSRLKPLTNVLPKALIPIGEKTILEEIMDKFVEVGSENFFISVNYKSDMIKHYFDTIKNPFYHIEYFEEPKPFGTAGSLHFLHGKLKQTFFVSNCDIIIDAEYHKILEYHVNNKNELTIVSALRHYPIPYGIIETGNDGHLIRLKEKPELTFQINSGFYILESQLLSEIPENEIFHMTDLIDKIMKRNGKIGVFPVTEGSWKDIGDWDEYYKTQLKKGHL
jgi:dTDP-glucose pyrophosphorylase